MEQYQPQHAKYGLSLGMVTLGLAIGAISAGFFPWFSENLPQPGCTVCVPSLVNADPSIWETALQGQIGIIYFILCGTLAVSCLMHFPRFAGGGKIATIFAGIAQIILGTICPLLMPMLVQLQEVFEFDSNRPIYSPAYHFAMICLVAFIPLGIFALVRGIMMHRVLRNLRGP